MSPTLVPVVNARSAVLRHVKRAEGHTDTSVVVLAVICVVILTVTLLSIARYFCRERRRNSSSSTDPSSRSPSHWYSPRCFGSLRTGRTATSSHQDPLPALPPRDPVRPWPATYRPRYPRVHFADRPYSHRSHRFGEYVRVVSLYIDSAASMPTNRAIIPHADLLASMHTPLAASSIQYEASRLRTSPPSLRQILFRRAVRRTTVDVQLSDIPQSHERTERSFDTGSSTQGRCTYLVPYVLILRRRVLERRRRLE
ncbi:hypothetical protein BKA82DRAFT_4341816 [Pisolithus tinctorius]|nr:hypothetical protein BKA82DRAFT_4341816 [Pisolithus tinctorius]